LVGSSCHTGAGNLPCKNIIHTVGPMYNSYSKEMAEKLLQCCILNTLEEAKKIQAKSVCVPAISSGIFGFPKDKCAEILL